VGSFGRLEWIAPQLDEVASRLDAGALGLLRSAGDCPADFLAFDRLGDEVVVWGLGRLPEPYRSYFPLEHSGYIALGAEANVDQRATLYAHVERHRHELPPLPGHPVSGVRGLRWPVAPTIAALREDARDARLLLAAG
jgi:hypothetical protein